MGVPSCWNELLNHTTIGPHNFHETVPLTSQKFYFQKQFPNTKILQYVNTYFTTILYSVYECTIILNFKR